MINIDGHCGFSSAGVVLSKGFGNLRRLPWTLGHICTATELPAPGDPAPGGEG